MTNDTEQALAPQLQLDEMAFTYHLNPATTARSHDAGRRYQTAKRRLHAATAVGLAAIIGLGAAGMGAFDWLIPVKPLPATVTLELPETIEFTSSNGETLTAKLETAATPDYLTERGATGDLSFLNPNNNVPDDGAEVTTRFNMSVYPTRAVFTDSDGLQTSRTTHSDPFARYTVDATQLSAAHEEHGTTRFTAAGTAGKLVNLVEVPAADTEQDHVTVLFDLEALQENGFTNLDDLDSYKPHEHPAIVSGLSFVLAAGATVGFLIARHHRSANLRTAAEDELTELGAINIIESRGFHVDWENNTPGRIHKGLQLAKQASSPEMTPLADIADDYLTPQQREHRGAQNVRAQELREQAAAYFAAPAAGHNPDNGWDG